MPRYRFYIAIALLLLAVLVGSAGAVLHSAPNEIVVPIDRTALEPAKLKPTENAPPIAPAAPEQAEPVTRSLALKLTPDARLIEQTQLGLLPRKGPNGERSADLYARPVDPALPTSPRPKLALVILSTGISETMTAEAYLSLPPDVSFSVSPYAQDGERQIRNIRNRGHEVFLEVQSIAENPKQDDRGPYALDPKKDAETNRESLNWMMSRFTGYVGLVTDLNPQAATHDGIALLLKQETETRGLARLKLVHSQHPTSESSPHDKEDSGIARLITMLPGDRPSELKAALEQLHARLETARKLIAVIEPGPLALDTLKEWLATYQSHEFDLVPLSAILRELDRM
jgi:polysaccharide deacetylase 2 family uncharacterized protein YibQ